MKSALSPHSDDTALHFPQEEPSIEEIADSIVMMPTKGRVSDDKSQSILGRFGFVSLAMLATMGCEEGAFDFLNNWPVEPDIICVGPPGARECGAGGRIYPGRLIGEGGAFVPPTAGEVASFSVDTSASTAPVVPGSPARVTSRCLTRSRNCWRPRHSRRRSPMVA